MTEENNKIPSLFKAVEKGNVAEVERLISEGVPVKVKVACGLTLLHLAAKTGIVRIAEALLKAKADVNAQSDDYSTPLHFAALYGKADIAFLFFKAGALLLAWNKDNKTPLDIAIEEHGEDSDIVRVFRNPMAWQGRK